MQKKILDGKDRENQQKGENNAKELKKKAGAF
jgi:hypothetical protein